MLLNIGAEEILELHEKVNLPRASEGPTLDENVLPTGGDQVG